MTHFALHLEAQHLHEQGKNAAIQQQDFIQAHEAFTHALELLEPESTTDQLVQAARITRDDGFTYLRAAISEHSPTQLNDADARLTSAATMTAPLVSGLQPMKLELSQPHTSPKLARREIWAEHGESVALLGRLATARTAIEATEAKLHQQQAYGTAYDLLRIGNNGYYKVSNDMNAARQERINGRLPHTIIWLGRAAKDLAWTSLFDRHNLSDSVLTSGSLLPQLITTKSAKASVRLKP